MAFDFKVAAGLGAILVNLYCVRLVHQRRAAAASGDWVEFDRLDHRQHRWGAVVMLLALVALAIGLGLKSGV